MLTAEEIDHFIETGYVHLHSCFDCSPGSLAHRWVSESWQRNGLDPDDMSTWPIGKIHMPLTEKKLVNEMSPRAFAAIHALCGGAERVNSDELVWCNAFIANYGLGRDQEWQPPGPDVKGWHKDGDFFTHFLDSPEQALLTIIVFSDIEPKGGGTFIAPDSIRHVAEFLLEHPEGYSPYGFADSGIIQKCEQFMEVTAKAGDVILMHPYMMHTSSFNHSDRARFIINPCCTFKEPMQFKRSDGAYSPVERAVLKALDVEELDFQITGRRERLVPQRLQYQEELLRKERERARNKTA